MDNMSQNCKRVDYLVNKRVWILNPKYNLTPPITPPVKCHSLRVQSKSADPKKKKQTLKNVYWISVGNSWNNPTDIKY